MRSDMSLYRTITCYEEPSEFAYVYERTFVLEERSFSKKIVLEIDWGDSVSRVLFVASYHTPISEGHLFAVHNDGVVLLFNEVLCLFSVGKMDIVKTVQLDAMGTMFGIYPYKDDYILYGEIEVYRVSCQLEVKWCFCGKDIFVRCSCDDPAFVMIDDKICLYDFLDNYYEIDYNGRLLREECKA